MTQTPPPSDKPDRAKPADTLENTRQPAEKQGNTGSLSGHGSAPGAARRPAGQGMAKKGGNSKGARASGGASRPPPSSGAAAPPAIKGLNFAGVFILAFGVAAFVAVLYLAYARFVAGGDTVTIRDAAPQAGMSTSLQQQGDQQAQPEKDIQSLKAATIEQMAGHWRTKYGVNTVDLIIQKDGQYALTLYLDAIGRERMFSKGQASYNADRNLLSLRPSYDPMPEVEGARYSALDYNPYGIVVLYNPREKQIYWLPGSASGRKTSVHPLFVYLGRRGKYIEWRAAS